MEVEVVEVVSTFNNGGGRPFCHGHVVSNCFHRFDRSFHSPSQQNRSQNNNYGGYPPQALYATPQTVMDPSWYMDSGASYHVTPHSAQFEDFTPTGEQASVTGIGSVSLFQNNSKLQLNDVLLVPTATKSLISVSKLTSDNPVNVHFTNSNCLVKDKTTGNLVAHGMSNEGLYKMSEGGNVKAQAHTVDTQNKYVQDDREYRRWHCKLGHPNDKVLKQILNKCNAKISFTGSDTKINSKDK